MFQFTGFPSKLCIYLLVTEVFSARFPIQISADSRYLLLPAAFRSLSRLSSASVPRHPPYALFLLTFKCYLLLISPSEIVWCFLMSFRYVCSFQSIVASATSLLYFINFINCANFFRFFYFFIQPISYGEYEIRTRDLLLARQAISPNLG